jgi:BirA family biotin operon repressor/biotin-[acetyl-CoA-carboxylase] ligase
MNESLIQSYLSSQNKFHLHVFNEIDSTNSFLVNLGNKGAPEWSVAVTEKQIAGKGRLNRKWESPEGVGLWLSILLRPDIHPDQSNLINLLCAMSLSDFLEQKIKSTVETDININLKWPNDLLVNRKKLSGILLQTSIISERVSFLVLGIGLNVNQSVDDFSDELKKRAISLRMITNVELERELLFAEFLEFFYKNYYLYFPENQNEIVNSYRKKVLYQNEMIKVNFNEKQVEGIFKGLTSNGYLILQIGEEEKIISTGEIVQKELSR